MDQCRTVDVWIFSMFPTTKVCSFDLQWCVNQSCVPIGDAAEPIAGGWGEWGEWSACSRSCGAGVSIKERFCDHPSPAFGGSYCLGERRKYKICNTQVTNISKSPLHSLVYVLPTNLCFRLYTGDTSHIGCGGNNSPILETNKNKTLYITKYTYFIVICNEYKIQNDIIQWYLH